MALDEGRLKGELRVTREKQARLRYQVRYLLNQHTRLRKSVAAALDELDASRPEQAQAILERALARAAKDPDTHYTPPGAKRKALKRQAKLSALDSEAQVVGRAGDRSSDSNR